MGRAAIKDGGDRRRRVDEDDDRGGAVAEGGGKGWPVSGVVVPKRRS